MPVTTSSNPKRTVSGDLWFRPREKGDGIALIGRIWGSKSGCVHSFFLGGEKGDVGPGKNRKFQI